MQNSYLLAGISSGKLFRLLGRNGFSIHPKYLIRVLFLIQGSLFATAFNRIEKWKLAKKLKDYKMPADPIFIIGHWRTGSTLLHQLMALDETLVTPNVFQVSTPESFLISASYYKPVMSKAMKPTRPMDNVKLGVGQPQEDEYALIKLNLDSPLEKLVFPDGKSFFLNDNDFLPRNTERWKESLDMFCKRLSFTKKQRVLLKNPFHSMRIPLLQEMYPHAKFIHIHRHPFEVVPSTIHMWHIVGNENSLKGKFPRPKVEDVAATMDTILSNIQENMKQIPENEKVEISFSELENHPKRTLKKIYNTLELKFPETLDARVSEFVEQMKSYKKNAYQLSTNEKGLIRDKLQQQINYYNYQV